MPAEWLRLWLREPCQSKSARVRSCPMKLEALAGFNSCGGFGFALSAMT